MNPGMRTSASGMIAQQKMVDVIANNLANVNTTGFKRSRAAFEDVLYETVQGPRSPNGEAVISAMQIGHGVRLAAVTRIDGQGGPEMTGRPLDLTIEGEGFFQVETANGGVAYTRAGSFTPRSASVASRAATRSRPSRPPRTRARARCAAHA